MEFPKGNGRTRQLMNKIDVMNPELLALEGRMPDPDDGLPFRLVAERIGTIPHRSLVATTAAPRRGVCYMAKIDDKS